MEIYRLFLIILMSAFFSCAVQAPPPGGPTNTNPLKILNINPSSGTTEINPKEAINFSFNQMISPQTAKISFNVYPETEINVSVIGNKIKITPINQWPQSFFKIVSSRNIYDYYGNKLEKTITASYSTNDFIPDSEISGSILNYDSTQNYEIGLFSEDTLKEKLDLVYKIELDNNGSFIFNNIKISN